MKIVKTNFIQKTTEKYIYFIILTNIIPKFRLTVLRKICFTSTIRFEIVDSHELVNETCHRDQSQILRHPVYTYTRMYACGTLCSPVATSAIKKLTDSA